MNALQQELIDMLAKIYNQDSIPLFFSEDMAHKKYQMMVMEMTTVPLWDATVGFADSGMEKSFSIWLQEYGRWN